MNRATASSVYLSKSCVKDPLVHEISVLRDVKQNPPKVVELKRRKGFRKISDRLLDGPAISTDGIFSSRFDLRDEGKSIAGWSSWIIPGHTSHLEA